MKLKGLLIKTRSYRKFVEDERIPTETLSGIVNLVRYTPSPMNAQPHKFVIVNNKELSERLFPLIKWAAYLKEWDGPTKGERPCAYIVMIGNREKGRFIDWDYGISLQTILLGLMEKGYGACTIASFDKEATREILHVEAQYEIAAIIAIGRPAEEVVIENVDNDNIRYWRDENNVHHVPKRKLDEYLYKVYE